MSEPPSDFHISPEDAGEINKAPAEAKVFELKKEAQAQGWLGQFWGGKDNASTNIVGLIIILLILFLFVFHQPRDRRRHWIPASYLPYWRREIGPVGQENQSSPAVGGGTHPGMAVQMPGHTGAIRQKAIQLPWPAPTGFCPYLVPPPLEPSYFEIVTKSSSRTPQRLTLIPTSTSRRLMNPHHDGINNLTGVVRIVKRRR